MTDWTDKIEGFDIEINMTPARNGGCLVTLLVYDYPEEGSNYIDGCLVEEGHVPEVKAHDLISCWRSENELDSYCEDSYFEDVLSTFDC